MLIRHILFVIFITIIYSPALQADSQRATFLPQPDILIIHSYHLQFPWTRLLNDKLLSNLEPLLPGEQIHVEFMDERRYSDNPQVRAELLRLYDLKYAEQPPDVVVVSDDAALNLVLNAELPWLKNTPLVFLGINVPEGHDLSRHPQHTGVLEGMAIEENIEFIRTLLPATREILLIADRSGLGALMGNEARQLIRSQRFHDIKLSVYDDFTFAELEQLLSNMPANSAVLFLAIHNDRNGEYFSYAKHLPVLSAKTPVPIFGMWGDLMMGQGSAGGMMHNASSQAEMAAQIVRKILSGIPAADIPVLPKTRFTPQLDERQRLRFNIPLSNLPTGTELHFRPQSFLAAHAVLIGVSLSIIVFLSLIILVLSLNIRRRQHAEQQWQSLRLTLEQRVSQRTNTLNRQNQQLTELSQQLALQANTDVLTGISNRRHGDIQLHKAMENALQQKTPLSLALIDVDYFKRINDQYGHERGDQILIELSDLLTKHIRPQDLLVRWGGEEFMLLLNNCTPEQAAVLCERLRQQARTIRISADNTLSISIGISSSTNADNTAQLLRQADQNLYAAKAGGRDRVIGADN
ncbi:ABC transporter substrate binding protein [Thalassolituus alkanivorans]|uniref:ABC transporter substrate binding protein n=1 Tax=Thalassolituus alkanivorans TaxID=2881055 RepID=UPI001E3658EA|nr:ABC transporter substrate binding protein [Thalassolituus alkanivorans]MCB2388551.1 diguanylate cyclase [Thalassolituus alkanivorans]MCB2423730.1 diguanylate cyclase [Thalassolituus alkanivorans]